MTIQEWAQMALLGLVLLAWIRIARKALGGEHESGMADAKRQRWRKLT